MGKIKSQLGIVSVVIGSVALFFVSGCQPKPPTLEEAKEIFNEAAVVASTQGCEGELSVLDLEVVRIGELISKIKAYPIYANLKIRCEDGDDSFSITIDESEISAFLRHKKPEGFEIFIPGKQ